MLTPLIHAAEDIGVKGGEPVALFNLDTLIGNIISAITPLGGLTFFVIVILAGYKYITSEGDPKKVGEASGALTFAFYGVIILALAYLILVIISRITGAELSFFSIYYDPTLVTGHLKRTP